MNHTDLRMAGSELGIDLTDPQDESPSSDSHQAAGVCSIPGLPANRCCRQYHKCRLLPPGAKQPLPGLGIGLA
jgi:hypothetical protein